MIEVKVKESELTTAAQAGVDEFIDVFVSAINDAIGGALNAETMQLLNFHNGKGHHICQSANNSSSPKA